MKLQLHRTFLKESQLVSYFFEYFCNYVYFTYLLTDEFRVFLNLFIIYEQSAAYEN